MNTTSYASLVETISNEANNKRKNAVLLLRFHEIQPEPFQSIDFIFIFQKYLYDFEFSVRCQFAKISIELSHCHRYAIAKPECEICFCFSIFSALFGC